MKLFLAALWLVSAGLLSAQTDSPNSVTRPERTEIPPEVPSRFPQYGKYMAIVEGKMGKGVESMGSGGLLKYKGKVLLFTNCHVLSGMQEVNVNLLDGTKLMLGNLGIGLHHDVAVIDQAQIADGIEVMDEVDKNVAIGDEVVVLGNSKGAGVVTELQGKVLGIGPTSVEISAPIVQGNSGSPIIHVKSGKVIGLATWSEMPQASKWDKGSRFTVIRHFGVRLDSIKSWEFPQWGAFIQSGQMLHLFEEDTKVYSQLAQDIEDDGLLTLRLYQASDNRLRQPVTEYLTILNRHDMAPQSVLEAKKKFLRDVVFSVTANFPPIPRGMDSFQAGELKDLMDLRQLQKKMFQDLIDYQTTIGKITLP